MKKNILLILTVISLLYSCNNSNNRDKLNKLIDESLSSNKNTEKVLLSLKFGMSKIEFENELNKLYLNEQVKIDYSGYSYEFPNNEKLNGINWVITSNLHNDSIVGVKLHSFKEFWKNNYNTLNETYLEIVNEYTRVYGNPSYSKSKFENYYLKDNLLISITMSETKNLGGTIYIQYSDKRKEKSIDLTKCRFDENGNSLDKWYFDLKEKNKSENPDI